MPALAAKASVAIGRAAVAVADVDAVACAFTTKFGVGWLAVAAALAVADIP
jgi:hypothetical protein